MNEVKAADPATEEPSDAPVGADAVEPPKVRTSALCSPASFLQSGNLCTRAMRIHELVWAMLAVSNPPLELFL